MVAPHTLSDGRQGILLSLMSRVVRDCRREGAAGARAEPMLSSFINAAICSQPGFPEAVAFVLAHRLTDANEEDEMTTMFCVFKEALGSVPSATLADLVAVRTRVRRRRLLFPAHPLHKACTLNSSPRNPTAEE